MDIKILDELDLDTYISWYAHELTTYFPGLYEVSTLEDMLHKTVEHIYLCDFDDEETTGDYVIYCKYIRIKDPRDRFCLFHEFTHALRACYFNYMIVDEKNLSGNQNGDYFASRKFNEADEGMTELIALLYSIRKENKDNSIEVLQLSRTTSIYRYFYGAIYFNQIHQMYKMLYGRNLINDYLTGENIYRYAFEVINFYLNSLHEDSDECLDLAYRLSNMIITFLADFGYHDFSKNEVIAPDDYYARIREVVKEKSEAELYDEFMTLELINKNILLNFPCNSDDDIKTIDAMGKNFLTTKMSSIEERLLDKIFGRKEKMLTFESLSNMVSDFIVQADESPER